MSIATTSVYSRDRRLEDFQRYQGNDLSAFIALWAAASAPCDKPEFKYYRWKSDHMRVVGNTRRDTGGEGAEVDFRLDSLGTGTSNEYAVATKIPRAISQFADQGLNILPNLAKFLQQLMYIDIEARYVTFMSTTTNHKAGSNNVTLAGGNLWSDYSNSTPLFDIETGRQAIRKSIGFYPNKAWMSPTVWSKLQFHPQILNSIKYTGVGRGSIALLAELIQIQDIRIGQARYVSSNWGAADVFGDVWDDAFYMGYSGPGATPLLPMSIPLGWHAARPVEGYPSLREVTESRYLDGPKIDQTRQTYTYTYNDVAGAIGGSYRIGAL